MTYELVNTEDSGVIDLSGNRVPIFEVLSKPNYIQSFWKESKVVKYTRFEHEWVNRATGKPVRYMTNLYEFLSESLVYYKMNKYHA